MKHLRKGFSLIELLVVIAVIAILLSLLYPMVANALNTAKHTGCVANIRSLCQGVSAYAYDNEGALPAPGWGLGADTWLSARGQIGQNMSYGDEPEDVQTGQIWPYITNYDSYRCPADNPQKRSTWDKIESVVQGNCYKLTSFCMNGSVIAYGSARTGYSPDIIGTKRVTLPIDLFGGDDIILWEADELQGNGGMWWDAANFPFEGMTGRHRTWGSVGCFDGHAEKLSRDDYYNVEAVGNVGRTRLWNVPSQFSSNGH